MSQFSIVPHITENTVVTEHEPAKARSNNDLSGADVDLSKIGLKRINKLRGTASPTLSIEII